MWNKEQEAIQAAAATEAARTLAKESLASDLVHLFCLTMLLIELIAFLECDSYQARLWPRWKNIKENTGGYMVDSR